MLGARVPGPERQAAADGQAGQAAGPSPLVSALASTIASTVGPAARRELPRPTLAVEASHRLLLSDGPGHDRAWLRIDAGRFAGTAIHLSLHGLRVEVCVLTPHEASRQTLSIAMDAVRNRLRARGLTMVEGEPAPGRRQTGHAAGHGDLTPFIDARVEQHGRPSF